MRKVFITYGDNGYSIKKKILTWQAKMIGFDSCLSFSRKNLDRNFIEKTMPYIDLKRGGGYWLWKPYIIFNALQKYKDDDILVYCDAGCQIDIKQKKVLKRYLSDVKNSLLIAFESGYPNRNYINDQTLNHFGILNDVIFLNAIQVEAGVLIIKNCKKTRALIGEWLELSINHPNLFTDFSSKDTNRKDFIEHRHDQAIFNVLFYKFGGKPLRRISNGGDKNPFLTTRTSDSSLQFVSFLYKLKSLLK